MTMVAGNNVFPSSSRSFSAKKTLIKGGPQLTQNFVRSGVMTLMPNDQAFNGVSYHNRQLKKSLLDSMDSFSFVEKLREEHNVFCDSLESHLGLEAEELTSLGASPDDHYVCDNFIVADDSVFIPRMGARSRAGEPEMMEQLLSGRGMQLFHCPKDGKFEGGDALVLEVDGRVGVLLGKRPEKRSPEGLEVRTNDKGRKAFVEFLRHVYGSRFLGAVVTRTYCLHVGTATEVIQSDKGEPIWLIHNQSLLNPQKAMKDLEDLFGLRKGTFKHYLVPEDESWGAPVLSNGKKVLLQQGCPYISEWLCSHGFEVKEVPWEAHQATDGNMRCKIQPRLPAVVTN